MTFPSSYTDFFADEQGKLQTILRFNGAINTSLLSDEDYVTDGTSVWVKGDINEKWALLPSTFFGAQYAAALVTIPNRITVSPTVTLSQTMYGGPNFRSPTIDGNFNPNQNPGAVAGPAALPFFPPASAALPVKSNTTTYGPWLATASSLVVNGHPFGGKVYYEQDDGLAPWEYGGFTYMNLGAAAKIDNSITNETVSERGSVTLAGYPEKTLGLAITDSPSLVATRVIQNGLYEGSNYYFVNTGGVSNKAAQITNIQVTVNGSAITTQYQISSFTPVFGRFNKDNAERVKQIGQQRLEFGRKIRAALAKQAKLASGQRKAAIQQFANMLNQSDADAGTSAYLTGKRFSTRPNYNYITNNTLQGASNFDDYDNSAIASMDTMQSPVQKRTGSSNLPKEVANPTPPAYQPNYSESPPPPISEYTPPPVSTDYLDFLGTPNSAIANRSDSSASGHNMADVARGKTEDYARYSGTTSIGAINDAGGDGYEQTDYRYIAHRGPLVVHGWGYDLLGKPVPNEDTDIAGNWDTSYANKTDKFKDAWLQDDTLWPTAPVDLRYDRKRGVWTVPPSFRMYKVTGDPISAGDTNSVVVLNAGDIYDSEGALINDKTINLTNITRSPTPSGQEYIAYYDNTSDSYWPIFPGSTGGQSVSVAFTPGNCATGSAFACTEFNCLEFSSGFDIQTGVGGTGTINTIPLHSIFSGAGQSADLEHMGYYSGIAFSGFKVQDNTEDACIIEVISDRSITDANSCAYIGSPTVSEEFFKELVFDSGMNVVNIDGVHHINSFLIGNGLVNSIGGDVEGEQPINKITFDDCLKAVYVDNCNLSLSTDLKVANYDPCLGEASPPEILYTKFCNLAFGRGLLANPASTTLINLDFTVDGKQTTAINFESLGNEKGTYGIRWANSNVGCDTTVRGFIEATLDLTVDNILNCSVPAVDDSFDSINKITFVDGFDVLAGADNEVMVFSTNTINQGKTDTWAWQIQAQAPNCAFYDSLTIGKGLSVGANANNDCGTLCGYTVESDFRVSKAGIECEGQEAFIGPALLKGMRTDFIVFGDYLKLSKDDAADKVRVDVCSPRVQAWSCEDAKTLDPNDAVEYNLLQLSNIAFEGLGGEIRNSTDFYIVHEHYAYGGCNGASEGYGEDIYSADLGSFGYKFQDLNFGECFKVSRSSANTINGDIGDCVVDIGLCGENAEVDVVCEVHCENDGRDSKKQKLTFEDGLLKKVSSCGDADTEDGIVGGSEGKQSSAVIQNGGQAIVNTDTDLSTVFGGDSLAVYGTAALGNITIDLPSSSLIGFAAITIFKADGTSNTVTVRPHSGETFANGDTSHVLTHTEESLQVVSNGLSLLRV